MKWFYLEHYHNKGVVYLNFNQVDIVQLEEMKFIGVPVTSSFQNDSPKRIEDTKNIFMNRKNEIKNVINPDRYVCPHYASEVLFTYLYCMEVNNLDEIPEGMIGFSIPAHRYVTTRSNHDPYEVLHTYLQNREMENNVKALALEVYYFENPNWPTEVDVYIPIKE